MSTQILKIKKSFFEAMSHLVYVCVIIIHTHLTKKRKFTLTQKLHSNKVKSNFKNSIINIYNFITLFFKQQNKFMLVKLFVSRAKKISQYFLLFFNN